MYSKSQEGFKIVYYILQIGYNIKDGFLLIIVMTKPSEILTLIVNKYMVELPVLQPCVTLLDKLVYQYVGIKVNYTLVECLLSSKNL